MVKVRLKKAVPPEVQKGPGRWLQPGNNYTVLAIESGGRGRPEYRIATEIQGTPALFDARLFDIVDARLPSNWIATAHGEHLEFQPAAWTTAGFWERFFDGDEDARRIYHEEIEKIGE